MKHSVIAMKMHPGDIIVNGEKAKITLPAGCIGIFFAFESKKAAREYSGNVEMVKIEPKQVK